jgi:peptide/nickel transport system substrate-binding protein
MAFAIDYEKIKKLAVSGYTTDIQSGLIMPFSAESTYFSQEEVDKYGATKYDPELAKKELELGGFKPHFDKKGNLVCVTNAQGDTMPTAGIMSPSGWTDYESVVRIAVTGMRAVGIDVRPNFVDGTQYWPAQTTGNFDLFFDTPVAMMSKSTPWSRFEGVMSAKNWKPTGQKMYENIGRWNNPNSANFIPQVDSLLHLVPLITNEKEKQKAYTLLNRYFMEEQPTIPVLYRPEEYYEFSTKYWTNFPTSENPYAPPRMPVASAGTRMLWEIVSTAGGN